MKVSSFSKKNKINTLLVHQENATAASIQFWFRAGSALESKKDKGIAHFLEHMFFKGTKKRPGSQIANEVESFGGELNAFTSFDFTCYYINCPQNQIYNSTDIILDMVSNPSFNQKDITPEIGVVHEEFKRSFDSPSQFAFTELQESFFTGKYQHQILGTQKTILNFSRRQLIEFRKKYYNQENSLLIISGNLKNEKKITDLVEKYKLPSGQKSSFEKFKLSQKNRFSFHNKEVANYTLQICFEASDFNSFEAPAEDLVMSIIGQGESSYLGKELVHEKAIANSVGASPLYMTKKGVFFLRINFPKENLGKVLLSTKAILKRIHKKGLSKDDINKAKFQSRVSKIYDRETIEAFSFSLGNGFAQNGDIYSESKFIDRQQEVSDSLIESTLQKILTSRHWHYQLQAPKGTRMAGPIKKLIAFDQGIKQFKKKTAQKKYFSTNSSKFDSSVKSYEIKPGIKLIHKHNKGSKTFNFQTYLKGGLSEENKTNNGIYNLLVGLLTSSTKNFTKDENKFFFESNAAFFSTFSGKNAYGQNLSGISEKWSILSKRYFEHLFESSFLEEELNFEKLMVHQSLLSQKEDPARQLFNLVSKTSFKNHPYRLQNIGDEASLRKLSSTKVRNLHHKNLKKKDILFVYSGPKNHSEVISVIESNTGHLKQRRNTTKTKLNLVKASKPISKNIYFEREQTHIFIGKQTPRLESKDSIFYKMLYIFLFGQGSPLFTELRDKKGLCYSVSPINFTALEAGYFGVYVACSNDKVKEAIFEVENILNRIRAKGLSLKEFNQIKKMTWGQFELSLQTNEDFSNTFATPFLHGLDFDFYFNQTERIKLMKYSEFNNRIKDIINGGFFKLTSGQKN